MPVIQYFRVTQQREVEVSASSIEDAFVIAAAAFDPSDSHKEAQATLLDGRVTNGVKQTHVEVDKI